MDATFTESRPASRHVGPEMLVSNPAPDKGLAQVEPGLPPILRPPTYAEPRRCGDCCHFKHDDVARAMMLEASCHHPLAEWNYGFDTMDVLRKTRPRWPAKDAGDWCGFWRPRA